MATLKAVRPRKRPSTLAEYDQKYSLYLHNHVGSRCPRAAFLLLEHGGNGILWLLVASFFSLLPDIESSTRCLAMNFLLGLLVDLALVGALKALIRRPRPQYNQSGDFVLVVAVDQYSFPSGHTARVCFVALAWCIATPSQVQRWLVWVWAIATALSRALMGRHYVGDVTAGLVVGFITTAIVTKGTYSAASGWIQEEHSEALHKSLTNVLARQMLKFH